MTGSIVDEIFRNHYADGRRLSGYVSATGSAGTIAAGDFLRTRHPDIRVVATEALQCPTLLQFGFGEHRIEGIGDKHVPWIHNVRNTDFVAAVDDEQTMQLMRLFNEAEGRDCLDREGVDDEDARCTGSIGISGICNLVASIKTARYYDMDGRDVIFTPLTDSMELYSSRMAEMHEHMVPTRADLADQHFGRYLQGATTDHVRELGYADQKALAQLQILHLGRTARSQFR